MTQSKKPFGSQHSKIIIIIIEMLMDVLYMRISLENIFKNYFMGK